MCVVLRAACIPLSGLIFFKSVTEACLWHLQFEDATKRCFAWNILTMFVLKLPPTHLPNQRLIRLIQRQHLPIVYGGVVTLTANVRLGAKNITVLNLI